VTKPVSPQKQLDGFLAKYLPEIEDQARACLKILRTRLPGAVQLVYDNYNALVIGFGPSEKASEAVFSLVLYPRYLVLFFLQGAKLPDPDALLRGDGKIVRHIRLATPRDLNRADIRELMKTALECAPVPFDNHAAAGRLVIRSVSPKQRLRKPL
jgi:hypothetical protein